MYVHREVRRSMFLLRNVRFCDSVCVRVLIDVGWTCVTSFEHRSVCHEVHREVRCSIEAILVDDRNRRSIYVGIRYLAMYGIVSIVISRCTDIVSIAVRFRCSIEAMYTTANVSIVFVISRCTFATYG